MTAKLVALVVPLGLDTFAVSAALGAVGVAGRTRLRIALLFTAFEAGMPVVGLALGVPLGRALGGAADYVAIGMLLAVGLYTLVGRGEHEDERLTRMLRLRGASAILLGVSISLDELAIGFTLGLLALPVALVITLIALQAFIVTQVGLRLGHRLKDSFREGAERLAGIVLAVLALVLLTEKLSS
jgi:putative Mn2+ efflux pump MntP